MKRGVKGSWPRLTLVGLVLFWSAIADTGLVRHRALAGPLAMLGALAGGLRDGSLLDDAGATLARVLVGVLGGALVGAPLGLWVGGSTERRAAVEPGLDFLRAIPPLLLFPLLLLALGYGEPSRVAAVAWAAGLVVALHAAAGAASSSRRRRDVLRAMGAGWIDRVRWLHVHELAPPLATALRHALGTAMVVGVVTEMVVGAEHGLGARALSAQIAYDAPGLYAVIALTGGIALALSRALSAIEGWARRRTIDLDESAAAQHAPRYLPMRRHSRWALAVILVGAGGAIAVGTAARSTFLLPEPVPQTATPRVVDRVRELFPQTAGWFRIVSGARFEPGEGGRLVPVLASLTHPRVRWQDGAGHAVVSQFAPHFRTATRIGSTEHAGVWLDLTPVEGRDVQAQIQDGLVVYPDAYASTDVLYKSTPTHVDEYLLLRDSQAPLRWAYRVRLGPGLARIRQAGNQIEAVDARGIPWLRAGMPRAVDREGRKVDGTIRIEGSRVEVALDVSGLSYPILVDPDWRSTGDMAYGRFYHRADVLDDGRVLVTGGCSASICSGDLTLPACRAVVPAIEAFDLASRTFARVVDSPVPRFFHVTQELTDGSILIAGGCTNPTCSSTSFDAEIFDPETNQVRTVAPLDEAAGGQASALLPDGRVLVAGGCTTLGCTPRAFAYDPRGNAWAELTPMRAARGRAATLTLPDGRVLITGGCSNIVCGNVLATAELFDPVSGEWEDVGELIAPRAGHWIASLSDGRAIVGGGCSTQDCASVLASTEILDPTALAFVPGPDMLRRRVGAVALALPDGAIVVNQGCASRSECDLTNELLEPSTGAFAAVEQAVTVRAFHQTVLHPSGQVLANGGCQPTTCSWWNETWDVSALRPPDGGVAWPDAGPPVDAGPRPDAGADGGPGPVVNGGCGCHIRPRAPPLAGLASLVVLALAARRRARR